MNVEVLAIPLNFILKRVSPYTLSVTKLQEIYRKRTFEKQYYEMVSILKLKPWFIFFSLNIRLGMKKQLPKKENKHSSVGFLATLLQTKHAQNHTLRRRTIRGRTAPLPSPERNKCLAYMNLESHNHNTELKTCQMDELFKIPF